LLATRAMPISLSRRRRRNTRGVTLVEILVVVAIIALVAGAVGVGAFKAFVRAQNKTAASNARALRGAVKTWWLEHEASACPDVDTLVSDGALDRDSPRRDPWGTFWTIECAAGDVTIVSAGPDQKMGTDDDIRIPPV
jgi:general secretion pathway protein G